MTFEHRSEEATRQLKDYIKRLHESPIAENRMVAVLMDSGPDGTICDDEAACRVKVRKIMSIFAGSHDDESPGDMLARKAREREEFQKSQDDAFKIKLLREFLADAERWNLGPQETKERELWIGRLKHHGIFPLKV